VLCTQDRGKRDRRNVLRKKDVERLVMIYDRPKFVEQRINFWAPDKIGRKYVETAPHGAVHCRVRRGEHGCRRVLSTRKGITVITRYGRTKFVLQCVDFSVPYKTGKNEREMTPYGAVLSRAGRDERACPRVLASMT